MSFEVASADGYSGPFDLICFFDCLHDMGDPTGAAAHARAQLAVDGHVMLVEPFAKDSREDNHGYMAALRYGMSSSVVFPARSRKTAPLVLETKPANPVCEPSLRRPGSPPSLALRKPQTTSSTRRSRRRDTSRV